MLPDYSPPRPVPCKAIGVTYHSHHKHKLCEECKLANKQKGKSASRHKEGQNKDPEEEQLLGSAASMGTSGSRRKGDRVTECGAEQLSPTTSEEIPFARRQPKFKTPRTPSPRPWDSVRKPKPGDAEWSYDNLSRTQRKDYDYRHRNRAWHEKPSNRGQLLGYEMGFIDKVPYYANDKFLTGCSSIGPIYSKITREDQEKLDWISHVEELQRYKKERQLKEKERAVDEEQKRAKYLELYAPRRGRQK